MAHWSYVCPDLSRCKALALLISSRGAASHQLTLNTAEWALRPLSSLPPWFASDTMVIIQVSIPLLLLTWISLWFLMFKLLNFAVFLPEMQKIKPQPFWSTCYQAGCWCLLVYLSLMVPSGATRWAQHRKALIPAVGLELGQLAAGLMWACSWMPLSQPRFRH